MSYIERMAEDWVYSQSDDLLIGSKFDPLLVIEVIIESSPSWGWSIIARIIELDVHGLSLPVLIAGPLESWIARYARDWIEFLEGEAKENDKFRWALGGLRQRKIDDETWGRIEIARGASWSNDEIIGIVPKNPK